MNINARRRTLIKGMSITTGLALSGLQRAFADAPAAAPPMPPGPDAGAGAVADARGWALNVSAGTPVSEQARAAFLKKKIKTAATQTALSEEQRAQASAQIIQRIGATLPSSQDAPAPGGVGYGVFYNDDYKQAWNAGTATSYDLICPQAPGGNVDTWLYLTTTNRAAYGVEAFVSYYGQNEPLFKIFDWAQAETNPWQIALPFSQLGAHLFPRAQSGKAPQVLSIKNATFLLGSQFWRNEVHLYNYQPHGWDLVYQYDYWADTWWQKNSWIGSWGPIVETFQPFYTGTNPLGARRTLLTEADENGHWNAWSLLQAPESYVRQDNAGFELRNIAPNFAFVALS
jgi:hypothetical protein